MITLPPVMESVSESCFTKSISFLTGGIESVCAQTRDVMKSDNMTSVNFMGKCLSCVQLIRLQSTKIV